MKKIIVLFVLLFPLISFASLDRDLYFGLKSDNEVTELQDFLTEQGIYSGPITGNFFSLTLKAVKAFQAANNISPISGYVGSLTRGKANAVLASQGIDSGVTNESGVITNPAATTPKTTDDVVAKLNDQIAILMKQIEELQKSQATLSQIQTQQVQQQQTLTQIQQNTTPPLTPPTPPPPVVPEVTKEIKFYSDPTNLCQYNQSSLVCNDIELRYFENGVETKAAVSISSDMGGKFMNFQSNSSGNPLTASTQNAGTDGKPTAIFTYYPSVSVPHTITVAANGASKSFVLPWISATESNSQGLRIAKALPTSTLSNGAETIFRARFDNYYDSPITISSLSFRMNKMEIATTTLFALNQFANSSTGMHVSPGFNLAIATFPATIDDFSGVKDFTFNLPIAIPPKTSYFIDLTEGISNAHSGDSLMVTLTNVQTDASNVILNPSDASYSLSK